MSCKAGVDITLTRSELLAFNKQEGEFKQQVDDLTRQLEAKGVELQKVVGKGCASQGES